ncbi:MAG: cyclic-di-AMP receptor [Aggregatilineales bacterium]
MKLILAIVESDAVDAVSRALVEARYTVTQISSIGGFLRRTKVTLVIGLDETQVEGALATIRAAVPPAPRADKTHAVTLFVLDAAQFVQV